jgi:hypothetical protein
MFPLFDVCLVCFVRLCCGVQIYSSLSCFQLTFVKKILDRSIMKFNFTKERNQKTKLTTKEEEAKRRNEETIKKESKKQNKM